MDRTFWTGLTKVVIKTLKARKSYLKRVDKAFASAEEFQAEKLKIATQTYEFVIKFGGVVNDRTLLSKEENRNAPGDLSIS